jgi:formylglycine-generating enzyme required for sulfatase activity
MSSLADQTELAGFFSYSRKDDERSEGALSRLRARISCELGLQLGRDFRLWQDTVAIPVGDLWEVDINKAIAASSFFIPIVTPGAVVSKYCRFEFEAFLKREAALGRNNLIFPILYVRVPALEKEEEWRRDDVLKIIGARQYIDWQRVRLRSLAEPEVAEKIEQYCGKVVETLRQPWVSPEQRHAEERAREEAEEERQLVERQRLAHEADERLYVEEAERRAREAQRRLEAEEQERQRKTADAARRIEEARRRKEANAARRVEPESLDETQKAGRPLWRSWLIGGGAIALVASAVLFLMPHPVHRAPNEPSAVVVAPTVAPPAPAPQTQVAGSVAERPLSPDRERALKPKDTFSECSRCPEMLVVPAGSFMMGAPPDEPGRYNDEDPQHKVTIAKSFAVSKFTLTFDNWDACVIDGGCDGYNPSDQGWGRGPQPVINVSWNDAKSYVAWLSRKTAKPYRLLSEAEYEYATRAETQTTYWWGYDIGTGNANCNGCGSRWDGRQPAPVGSFAPNQFGLYDMSGNVWAWVEDCWHDSYQGSPSDGSAWTTACTDDIRRVIRGGSWSLDPQSLRAAFRLRDTSVNRVGYLGFRLARTLNP